MSFRFLWHWGGSHLPGLPASDEASRLSDGCNAHTHRTLVQQRVHGLPFANMRALLGGSIPPCRCLRGFVQVKHPSALQAHAARQSTRGRDNVPMVWIESLPKLSA